MASSSGDLKSIQSLDNSALEPFSHRLADSGRRCVLPEKDNTQFERTSSTGDINEQSLPHRRLEFSLPNNPVGPLSLEGFVPWPFPSSASYTIESSGSSVQECHDPSKFECQKNIAANAMETGSGINTFEGMGVLHSIPTVFDSIPTVHHRPVGNSHPATSTERFDRPGNEEFHSEYQKEHSALVYLLDQANFMHTFKILISACSSGGLQCRWEGCAYSGKFSREASLFRHIRAIHINPDLFKCHQCEKVFTRRDKLRAHLHAMHHEFC